MRFDLRRCLPALGAAALASCGDLRVIPEGDAAPAPEIPIAMTNFVLTSHDEITGPGQRVEAVRGEMFEGAGYATLQDFTLHFYQDGQVVSEVSADWGRVDIDRSTFVAFAQDERIKIRRLDENVILYVTQIAYDPETRRLTTALPQGVEAPGNTDEQFVMVQATPDGGAWISQGRGVSADLQLNARFTRPSMTRSPTFDVAAFDAEYRPIHREDTP
ncbi:MAG: hypothetical protein HUU25_00765 [Candidatus Sumerlaeia bacterium]|nr:hypothetical protein [Candidatus Sumerlaeia bacterium]